MARCSNCKAYVSPFAQSCPRCGVQFRNRMTAKGLLIFLLVLLILSLPAFIVLRVKRAQGTPPQNIQTMKTVQPAE